MDECRREELLEGLGNSGAFGLIGMQGTPSPPTGAGGGWDANEGATINALPFNTLDGVDCGQRDLELAGTATSNENGEWVLPLPAGEYCFVFQTGSFFDAGVGAPGTRVMVTAGQWLAMPTR